MTERYRMFAGFNRWANERLYAKAAELTDAEYRADRGAFFKSVHGTLNHLLVGDRIWMHRLDGTGDCPTRLDAILFDDLADLHAARRAEDERILRYVKGLDEAKLSGPHSYISYRTIVRPAHIRQSIASTLDHFFNHQTHHRGQVHTLLTGLRGRDFAPSLDLLVFQRETGLVEMRPEAPAEQG
jgi:uncharacterized damage-inducible protein DinB